MTFTEIELR